VPVPWEDGVPSFGFGPADAAWLPQPAEYGELAADRQRDVPGSTLTLYTSLLALRKELRLGRGTLTWLDGHPADVLAFVVTSSEGSTTVLANLGDQALALPQGADVLASSLSRHDNGFVATDETVWLRH
jgi:alpha-glucosidase